MTAPRWEDVPEAARGAARQAMSLIRDTAPPGDKVRAAIDAALARLAEPAQPSAAERWRAVPEHAREAMIAELETSAAELDTAFGVNSAGKPWADHAAATRALLALAREAEGT